MPWDKRQDVFAIHYETTLGLSPGFVSLNMTGYAMNYVSFDKLKSIIGQFIAIYNTQRYHGVIGYVTPEQKHIGQAEEILKKRSERKRLARLHRLNVNRQSVSQLEWEKAT